MMAYTNRFTLVTGHEFPNKDFNYTEEYFELQRLWNTHNRDPLFNLPMEVLRGDRDAIRIWELFAKANNINQASRDIREMQSQMVEMKKILSRISKPKITQSNSVLKPRKPKLPKRGSGIDIWFDYYHAMNKAGFKMTFAMLAEESGYSKNTFKVEHKRYKLQRGIDLPNN